MFKNLSDALGVVTQLVHFFFPTETSRIPPKKKNLEVKFFYLQLSMYQNKN